MLDDDPETALQAIESAIRQEPKEPLFYGIRGKILARQGRYQAAIRAFDAAVRRDTGYYEH
ncbi:MAG: tetratricopeptide repeat protein [Rhodobacteraceae bacterium]|nr:tetratricopeptide repeat protein [Paracoccaceae bacterium]